MRTPAQVKAELIAAQEAIAEAFNRRDFDGAGICQDAADRLARELRDFEEEHDHYQDFLEMERVEKPYREIPDSEECWSTAGA